MRFIRFVHPLKLRSRAFGIACALVVFVLANCSVWQNSACGWALKGGKWPQSAPGAPVTITYSYNNLFDGGLKGPDGVPLPASLIKASVEEAFRVWASAAPLDFVEVADHSPSSNYSIYNDDESGDYGQIRLSHYFYDGPDVPNQQPKAKAITYYLNYDGNLAGDIFYDSGDPWQQVGTLATPDILGATIHELGHALGLDHSADTNSNMYWIFRRYNGPGTNAALTADDIAGIQSIYGAGVGSVTPLPVPEPASWLLAALGGAAVLWRRRLVR
jgi:hypothetical protein